MLAEFFFSFLEYFFVFPTYFYKTYSSAYIFSIVHSLLGLGNIVTPLTRPIGCQMWTESFVRVCDRIIFVCTPPIFSSVGAWKRCKFPSVQLRVKSGLNRSCAFVMTLFLFVHPFFRSVGGWRQSNALPCQIKGPKMVSIVYASFVRVCTIIISVRVPLCL